MTIARTICLGFIAIIALGAFLLLLPISTASGAWNDPIVALFTSTSAVCVTGLAVVDTGTHFSLMGQIFLLLLIQVGGLGYMTVSTFLLLLIGRRFDIQQKFAIQESFDRPFFLNSQNLIKSILGLTLIFEITGAIMLTAEFYQKYPLSKSLWLGIFHSVSAWNNAGFGLFANNFMDYQSSVVVNLVVPLLVIFGGIGYQVILEMYIYVVAKCSRKKWLTAFSLNFRVVTSTTIFLLAIGTIALFLAEVNNQNTLQDLPILDKIMAAWFQSTITRTAGFNSIDIGKMTTTGLFITIALMFIGASPSGTGGGIKTTTLRILTQSTQAVLQGKEDIEFYGRTVPISVILKAIGVLIGSIALVITATIVISITDPNYEFIQILFETVSAFATVGLSTGITASISPSGKLALIVTMYIGRVGVILLMAAILGDPRPTKIRYPEENLLVG
jgi:trk system potassium uptake protein TrkH